MTDADPDAVVEQLATEWTSLRELFGPFDDQQWSTPTALPGWTVKDCVSHITGTERMLMGDPAPAVAIDHLAHVKNPFSEIVEVWVEERRAWPPAAVVAEYDEHIARRLGQLQALSDDDLSQLTASPLGEMTERDWLKVRVFDCWMHEQDIRRALGRRGHLDGPIVVTALQRFKGALGYVVGKQAGAPDGSTVVFHIEDGPCRSIAVRVEGRARVIDDEPADPTVRLSMPLESFVALGGGRCTADDALAAGTQIEGDAELGRRILDAMAFTP